MHDAPYTEAAQAGADAVDADDVGDVKKTVKDWMDHVRPYAAAVPKRIASDVADTLLAVDDGDTSVDDILAKLDEKMETLRSSVTRYAEPPWGAGQQAYGEALDANDVMLVWVLDDVAMHCGPCIALADGSPYERGAIPTWPKAGDTPCMDKCYCAIIADPDTWAKAFPPAA